MHGMDDPAQARFAWMRFRRILTAMTLVGVVAAIVAVYLLGHVYGELGWFATIATLGGVIGSVAMAGALMGLAFMSSGTGHDEAVDAAAGRDATTGRAPRKDVGP